MVATSLWLAAAGPVSLAGVGIHAARNPNVPVRRITWLAEAAALLALAAALATAAAVAVHGSLQSSTLGLSGIGFSLYADRLSAVMVCLVAFVGAIVVAYSRTYMDGDPGHARFTGRLCITLSAVLLVILAGNLLLFTVAWFCTSLALNRLLLFYPERPAALLAARKKFVASRLGDLCLIGACVLLYRAFGSLDYAAIFAGADTMRGVAQTPAAAHAIAILLVCTAMLKSAQFPTHGWLIEVMETPTPVSALLHAGIINAGGFLIIRFSDVITLSLPSLHMLALLGGFTALFGSVVMLTQTSIKVSLAWSTVAQMGFMMLECGLGAFSAATLHIVAHSFYKAHAFLSSGSVIDIYRTSFTPNPGGKPHKLRWIFAIGGVLAVTFVFSVATGYTITAQPGVFALGAVLLLSLTHLVANGIDERPNGYVVGRVLAMACFVAIGYFGLQFGSDYLLDGSLPKAQPLRGPFGVLLVAMIVGSYAVVIFLQGSAAKHQAQPRWQALYAHVHSGFYVNTLANRLVLQYWPRPAPTRSPGAHA
nr:NADH-quinone oxidoreductase subunit L [uncultured Rhodopila sp.]